MSEAAIWSPVNPENQFRSTYQRFQCGLGFRHQSRQTSITSRDTYSNIPRTSPPFHCPNHISVLGSAIPKVTDQEKATDPSSLQLTPSTMLSSTTFANTTTDTTQHDQVASNQSGTANTTAPTSDKPAPIYAFVAPRTGISYTRAELDAWAKGKVNANGDLVYFKPAFVSEDPWFRLRDGKKRGPPPGHPAARPQATGMNIGVKREHWGKKQNPNKRKEREDDEQKNGGRNDRKK